MEVWYTQQDHRINIMVKFVTSHVATEVAAVAMTSDYAVFGDQNQTKGLAALLVVDLHAQVLDLQNAQQDVNCIDACHAKTL